MKRETTPASPVRRSNYRLPLLAALLVATPALLSIVATPAQAREVYRVDSGGDSPVVAPAADGAYLGVQLEEEVEHGEGGARVTRVVDDSPADRAGLRKGDIIVGFDGKTIRGPVALTRQIHASKPGDKSTLRIVRDGKRTAVDVELGERKSVWSIVGDNVLLGGPPAGLGRGLSALIECDDDADDDCGPLGNVIPLPDCEGVDCRFGLSWGGGRPVLGVELVEVTDELRRHLGGNAGAGVLISKIVSGTPAERASLAVGDLIVSVGGETIRNTRDLRRALRDKRGETFRIEVVRDRRTRSIEVILPAPEDDRPTGPRARMLRQGPRVPAPPAPAWAPAPPRAAAPTVSILPEPPIPSTAPTPPAAVAAPPRPPGLAGAPSAPPTPRPPTAPAPAVAPWPEVRGRVV